MEIPSQFIARDVRAYGERGETHGWIKATRESAAMV